LGDSFLRFERQPVQEEIAQTLDPGCTPAPAPREPCLDDRNEERTVTR
jgi:hypothetical protein